MEHLHEFTRPQNAGFITWFDDKRKRRNNMLFSLVIERWGRENRKLAVEVDR
jgi:hypothetical protein